jgi:hypothetical protein
LEEAGLRIIERRSTRLANQPPPAIVELFRRQAVAGRDADADMQSYQFVRLPQDLNNVSHPPGRAAP